MNQINNKNINEIKKYNSLKLLSKKKIYFKVKKQPNYYYSSDNKYEKDNINEGRWSYIEQKTFIKALSIYGINYKKIQSKVKTRTLAQIRSHTQKFFKKLKRCKNKELGIDFTNESIKSFKDMIDHIKSANNNYDISNILLKLNYNKENDNKHLNINDFLIKNESISNIDSQMFIQNNNKFDLNNINYLEKRNYLNNINNNANELWINYLNKLIIEKSLFNLFYYNYLQNKTEAHPDNEQSYMINNTNSNDFKNPNIK